MPDSLCFPFFTQAINEILSTSPCHCLVGFPLHPAIASFPLCAPASTAHSLYALAFLLPFVWFATARNDIAPSRLYSILSSLISIPICVHARKVRRETFPALLLIPFLGSTAAYCFTSITLYRLSPVHLLLLSVQHDSMFILICLSSASCLRGLAPSVMLNLLHVCGLNAHALLLTCAALTFPSAVDLRFCLLCLVSTFVY